MRRSCWVLVLLALLLVPAAAAHDAQSEHAEELPAAVSPSWVVASAANGVMALLFAAIAVVLWISIFRGGQLRSNPLLTGMALIFTTCSIGHAVHFEHTLLPWYATHLPPELLLEEPIGAVEFGWSARLAMTDPGLIIFDVLAAGAVVFYWTVRKNQAHMIQGAELSDDLELRERDARVVHGAVAEKIDAAIEAAEKGDTEEAEATIEAALEQAQSMVAIFLEEGRHVAQMGAGELSVRE